PTSGLPFASRTSTATGTELPAAAVDGGLPATGAIVAPAGMSTPVAVKISVLPGTEDGTLVIAASVLSPGGAPIVQLPALAMPFASVTALEFATEPEPV